MEKLFNTEVIIDGEYKRFDVLFDREAYVFVPEDGGATYHIARIDDAWKVINGQLSQIAQQQAEAALDRYLLSQH